MIRKVVIVWSDRGSVSIPVQLKLRTTSGSCPSESCSAQSPDQSLKTTELASCKTLGMPSKAAKPELATAAKRVAAVHL